jgi:hypothetical protein
MGLLAIIISYNFVSDHPSILLIYRHISFVLFPENMIFTVFTINLLKPKKKHYDKTFT